MRVIRVTQVLDYFQAPQLVEWKMRVGKREANKIGRQTAKFGQRLDELIKTQAEPKRADKPEIKAAYNAYFKWVRNYTPIEIKPQKRAEKGIYGVILSGEPDIIALSRLTDIKQTNRLYLKFWLQLAAYAWLTDWLGELAVLRLDRNTESYQYEVRENIARYWEVYKGLLQAYIYFTEEEDDGGNDIV